MRFSCRKLIGSREFYKIVLAFVIPVIVQNAITNFVSLLDNLMVGALGTEEMSGVAIANQLIFVYNLSIFGTISGAGIFSSQFHGARDDEGVRMCFRYKLIACLLLFVVGSLLFLLAGTPLIRLYLTDTSDPVRVQTTLNYALDYMRISVIGLLPYALTQSYAGTLREIGETRIPMYAGMLAVAVNTVFNYLLIFGKLGLPALGVRGAAIATVLSRYAELAFIAIYTHRHTKNYRFAQHLYRTIAVPRKMAWKITTKAVPLFVNELLWSAGITAFTQIYCLRGLDVVAAMNISATAYNLLSTVYIAMGNAAGIILGQHLGANRIDAAKDDCGKLIVLTVVVGMLFGGILMALSGWIPSLYNTTDSVRTLAARLIMVSGGTMILHALVHVIYFALRSGGNTGVTFLFDCVYSWCVLVPAAFLLTKFCTGMDVVIVYLCVELAVIPQGVIGLVMIKRGRWLNNMTKAQTNG